ncbi:MAG: sulfatase [Candidatus Binatia bacterium]
MTRPSPAHVGAVLLAGLLTACRPAPPPNVVVILVDALRADRLGCYGGPRGLTPFIDSLAARGTRFRNAYAASSWTNPSVASLFTSRWQSQHGVVDFQSALPATERTLAETFRDRGYATAAFIGTYGIAGHGFEQGFDTYQLVIDDQRAEDSDALHLAKGAGPEIDAALFAWLDRRPPPAARQPLFLYLHFMEPHLPYAPKAANVARILGEYHQTPEQLQSWYQRWYHLVADGGLDEPSAMDMARDLYDAELLGLDDAIRDLVAGLERRGLLDTAVVVFTADHGEEFFEHGKYGHGVNLYNDTLRVPLVLLTPGQADARDVRDTVSLVDVAPTLVALAGGPTEPSFEGRSLRDAGTQRVAYAELARTVSSQGHVHDRAVVVGDRKLAIGPDGHEQAFDLANDPGEHDPSALAEPERAALRERLAAVRSLTARNPSAQQVDPLDEATQRRLRALGYLR